MSKHGSRLIDALDRADSDNNWSVNTNEMVRDSSASNDTPLKTRPETHQKLLKGNATGLHMKTVSPRPMSPMLKLTRSVIVENKHPPSKTRRSLSLPKKKINLDFELLNGSSSVVTSPVSKRYPTKSDANPTGSEQPSSISCNGDNSEKIFAICNNCGITTTNFVICERCNTKLPKNPKVYVPQKQEETQKVDSSSSTPGRFSFYKNHLVNASYNCNVRRRKIPLAFQRFNGKRAKNVSNEPPVLTLSSDEELEEVEPEVESRTNGSNIENKDSNNALEDSKRASEDPLVGCLSESEGSTTSSQNENHKIDGDYVSTLDEYLRSAPEMEKGGIAIQCRSIRIGSYKIAESILRFPVGFTFSRVALKVPPVGDEKELVTVEIRGKDIVQAISHFSSRLQIIFLRLTPLFASFVRTRLEMFKHDGPYYDSESEDDKIKWIVLLPIKIETNQRSFLNMMFNELGSAPGAKERIHREADYKTANDILVKSSPADVIDKLKAFVSKKPVKRFSNQPPLSPLVSRVPVIRQSPRLAKEFSGTTNIATYPPAPQRGGITVTLDDMKRLNPGELINDVLIDFYMKYLFYEKLSEDDRKRTHIFSSFFYKGLNLRADDNSGKEDLAQKRHSRVKTWTRHVDLFEKDFIIIPVNENAHWFLAVICFPYLAGVVGDEESCPPPSAEHDYESDSMNETSSSSQTESKTNGESLTANEDIFSDILSNCSTDSSEVQKRPCILIFDSFSSRNCWNNIIKMLRDYLSVEFQEKKKYKRVFSKETIRGSYPKAPQQTNSVDCGLYVLQYAESFFEKPIKNFMPPIQEVQKWFTSDYVARTKRTEIGQLIMRLHAEQSESKNNCQKGTEASVKGDLDKTSSSPSKS